MSDDALEIWRREIADAAAPPPPRGSTPPPRGSIPPPGRRRRPLPRLVSSRPASFSAPHLAGLVGAVLGAVVVFAHGWPPGDGLFLALAMIPLLVGGIEYARTRDGFAALLRGVTAGFGAGLAAAIIVPAWGFLEFVECWMSWLSDC